MIANDHEMGAAIALQCRTRRDIGRTDGDILIVKRAGRGRYLLPALSCCGNVVTSTDLSRYLRATATTSGRVTA